MNTVMTSGVIVAVTTGIVGPVAAHASRYWGSPARVWTAALSRLLFTALLAAALNAGLTVAVVLLVLPGLLWLRVLLAVVALLGPWVTLYGVLKAQRWRLNESCRNPRTAQSLIHFGLTIVIAGTFTTAFVPRPGLLPGWNDIANMMVLVIGFAVVFLPALRRAAVRLWVPGGRVAIKRASRRSSSFLFLFLCVCSHLQPIACPTGRCEAGGGPGLLWALTYSLGLAWLIATGVLQLGPMLHWLENRSRDPGPPPPWFRHLVQFIWRPRSA
jgi:hypothetical protein